jgi:hypothetical protein
VATVVTGGRRGVSVDCGSLVVVVIVVGRYHCGMDMSVYQCQKEYTTYSAGRWESVGKGEISWKLLRSTSYFHFEVLELASYLANDILIYYYDRNNDFPQNSCARLRSNRVVTLRRTDDRILHRRTGGRTY